MDLIKKIQTFISHWYTRYLLATELYMVEPWEKAVVHLLFAIIFGILWYFNYNIVLSGISKLTSGSGQLQPVS